MSVQDHFPALLGFLNDNGALDWVVGVVHAERTFLADRVPLVDLGLPSMLKASLKAARRDAASLEIERDELAEGWSYVVEERAERAKRAAYVAGLTAEERERYEARRLAAQEQAMEDGFWFPSEPDPEEAKWVDSTGGRTVVQDLEGLERLGLYSSLAAKRVRKPERTGPVGRAVGVLAPLWDKKFGAGSFKSREFARWVVRVLNAAEGRDPDENGAAKAAKKTWDSILAAQKNRKVARDS